MNNSSNFIHNFNRRCRNHDYHSRCIYMITILKSPGLSPFASIRPDPSFRKLSPIVELTPAGEIIREALREWQKNYPKLNVIRTVTMPDHIHILLFVTERTALHLGSIIAAFKSKCTSLYSQLFGINSMPDAKESFFAPGFNDKIAFRAGAKDAFYRYIADNPRRYLIKKICPEYFYHKLMIEINGRRCGLYGNLLLLDNPVKSAVRISRNKTRMRDLPERIGEWEEVIRCQGVLVSPFINPEEKKYRDAAIANDSGLILIVNYRFSDRAKPYRELFNLCAEGLMLIISTEKFVSAPQKMWHSEAMEMNDIAAAVAALRPREARLLPR